MKKCSHCGFTNDDFAEYCAACGDELPEIKPEPPKPEEPVSPAPPKPSANIDEPVSAENEYEQNSAPFGDEYENNTDNPAPFGEEYEGNTDNFDPFDEPPASTDTGEQKPAGKPKNETRSGAGAAKEKPKGAIGALTDKAASFEKKHGIILNAIVIVCALVVILVTLLAPVKLVVYGAIDGFTDSYVDEYETASNTFDGDSASTATVHYLEISQSLFQAIGAISYVSVDRDDIFNDDGSLKAEIDVFGAIEKYKNSDEYEEWLQKGREIQSIEDEDKRAQALLDWNNELFEGMAECLSDVNVLGFIIGYNGIMMDEALGSEGATGIEYIVPYLEGMNTLVYLAVIFILAVIACIVSLVQLVKAAVGMAKKKTDVVPNKYFATVLGLLGTALLFSMFAPMLVAGGGVLAAVIFISVAYFVYGLSKALLFDLNKEGLPRVIKRVCIAVFGTVAFFILTTRIYAFSVQTAFATTVTNGELGYGMAGMLSSIRDASGVIDSGVQPSAEVALRLISSMLAGVSGFASSLTMSLAVIFAFCAFMRTLKRLTLGMVERSSCNAFAIAAAIFMIISLVIVAMAPSMLVDFIAGMYSELEFDIDAELTASFALNAQVWVSMIFLLVSAIVNIAYKPLPRQVEPKEQIGAQGDNAKEAKK